MLYIVEVTIAVENLALELSQMRTWLDHMKFQAIGFRKIPDTDLCRVDFESEQEARAFAQAFAGRTAGGTAAYGGLMLGSNTRSLGESRDLQSGRSRG